MAFLIPLVQGPDFLQNKNFVVRLVGRILQNKHCNIYDFTLMCSRLERLQTICLSYHQRQQRVFSRPSRYELLLIYINYVICVCFFCFENLKQMSSTYLTAPVKDQLILKRFSHSCVKKSHVLKVKMYISNNQYMNKYMYKNEPRLDLKCLCIIFVYLNGNFLNTGRCFQKCDSYSPRSYCILCKRSSILCCIYTCIVTCCPHLSTYEFMNF